MRLLREFEFDCAELHLLAVLFAVNGALGLAAERLQSADEPDPRLVGALASAAGECQAL